MRVSVVVSMALVGAMAACSGASDEAATVVSNDPQAAVSPTSKAATPATGATATSSAPVTNPAPTTDSTPPQVPITATPGTSSEPEDSPADGSVPEPTTADTTPSPDGGGGGPATVEHRSGPEGFSFDIAGIDPVLRQRIEPTSWRPGCPVALHELRYLRLSHHGFDGAPATGELIVHRDHVEAMFQVFSALWTARFPIRSMRLIDDFGGDDYRSIEADNTSAFNCRFVEGTSRWSNHAFGGAIDINPLENPYVSGGGTSHPASVPFLSRQAGTGVIVEIGPVVAAFDAMGWDWGGRWGEPLDYQHFSAAGG